MSKITWMDEYTVFSMLMKSSYVSVPAEVVWAVPGADSELPCDLSTTNGDKVNMVLWFKDATGIPLYRYHTYLH